MAMIGMLVLGLLIGIGLAWHLDERRHAADMAAREARHAARLRQMQDEVFQADSAHAETKERLISLQLAQPGLERQAAEAETWRARCAVLEQELLRLRPAGDTALPAEPSPVMATAATAPAAAAAAGDDLTRIKGIGQVMQRRLGELGILSFRQLAELTPAEVQRINGAIDFPGRIERERWVEQARRFLAR